jgi:peptidyl-prolyl cis-trans isomerase D
MLAGLRKAGNTLVGRIVMALVMGFISLSFAVWGIGDIFSGFGGNTVAKVGGTEISAQAFTNLYQTQLQQMQEQARRAITNDEARAMGLDTQVLSKLVTDALLDQRARNLGLRMSDKAVAQSILSDPTFAGPDGKFDSSNFQQIVQNNGYTQQSFALEQRNVYLRREVANAVAGDLSVPQAALEALHRYNTETRSVDYFTLPEQAAGTIPPPTQDQLQKYFDDRRPNYRAPEFRKLVVLSLTPTSVADPSTVSDADAQALYDKVKGQRYGTPEKRDVQQIMFPNQDEANAAAAKIKAGASFASIAAERKLTDKDIDLGAVAKSDILDPSIADAAFSLPADGISEPVKTQFGVALLHVTEITPESVKPFADVADEIKKDIAIGRGKTKVDDMHDKIEDARTSGDSLADAAKTVGLTVGTADSVDATGHDKSGAEVKDLPDRDALLQAAFASDIGVDNDTISTRDGGYVWFEVAAIDPAHDRTLDDVKDQVAREWHDDQVATALASKAGDLVKQIEGGQTIEAAAAATGGLTVEHIDNVKRSGGGDLAPGVVAQIFDVPVNAVDSAGGAGLTRVVFKVLDSVVPALDPESTETKTNTDTLKAAFGEDLLGAYLAQLQTDVGVTVNQAALNNAIGGSSSGSAGY